MKIQSTLFLLMLFCIQVSAQEFTVSGTVRDASSGETLIGATVAAQNFGAGTLTNEYGFYSISLPARDSVILEFSYVGFQTQRQTVFLTEDMSLNIELGSGVQLEEVVVKANSDRKSVV